MSKNRAGGGSNRTAVTIVVCVALGTVVAAMSSLNLALPSIARDTHATQTQLEWVIDAYSLAFASLLLAGGALGDSYGRRRALIVGLLLFGGGSAVAATANSATELIALRALLGVGASLVMPATLSTITATYPPAERTRAVSTWAAVAGGAAILGLLCAGLLLTSFSWPSVFYLNVVLATIALLGTLRFVPESADPDAPRLDIVGAVLAVISLVLIVYSVIEAPDRGWLTARTIAGLGGGLAVLVLFFVWESRQAAPLLDPRLFRNRRLSSGSLSILIQFFAFFGFTFTGLQYLEGVRGDTPLLAAVSVLPLAGTMMPASRLTPTLVARLGSRAVNVGGLVLVAIGLTTLSRLGAHTPYILMLAGLVLLGIGMGAAMTPATSAITESLPAAQ
jgi:EmrB/QacA subfamily drug resistance transporter